MSNPSSTNTYQRSEFPGLNNIRTVLRKDLYRIYPTRYVALNPPAQAVRVTADMLEIPGFPEEEGQNAIVVFLPADYEQYLTYMAETLPQLYSHPDVGLQSQVAYLSFSTPPPAGQLPMTLWLELSELMAAHVGNEDNLVLGGVPIVLAAGASVAVALFAPDATQLQQCRDALTDANHRPTCHGVEDIVNARQKAERYGERPWLFMRYELKAGNRRMAVNWAPFGILPSGFMGN